MSSDIIQDFVASSSSGTVIYESRNDQDADILVAL